ncbi:HNH endonuclease [Gordonia sp. ABSL1-1]|uniref:HNH endonuclease signature motif containing protein n=1 Tax=Gordonia sp. ABSL1-1 TaxID=3053923 RepID=UPI002572E47F|nr:HNH endonuclease signature motif containing protein [Gordonia sp. ABSL1-1]MDL9935837.1 HNH endonuclease [Gordonia sp. ABSL1-1]
MRSSEVADTARAAQRVARQAEARMVLCAYQIGRDIHEQFLTGDRRSTVVDRHIADSALKVAVAEVSLQLKISRTQASKWIDLADRLTDLPEIRLSFLAGDHALSRIVLIANALMLLDADVREGAQTVALDLAERYTADRVLRDQLSELVITLDPDKATDAREDFAERHQNVIIRDEAHGHTDIDATVPAEHGLWLCKKIAALVADRVCPADPRPLGRRRVVALAELHGLPGARLSCECGRADCPKHIAAPHDTDHTNSDTDANSDTDTASDAPAQTESAIDSDAVTSPLTVVTDPTGIEVPHLLGYGALDPAHADEIADLGIVSPIAMSQSTISEVSGLFIPDSQLAPVLDPTGHGGYRTAPPGALSYRPSPRMRAQIIATDRICRYPMCGRAADDCQLDHLVPFDHDNPELGGWTVAGNLIPLCTPDHHRKHLGLWIPTMHRDRTVSWHNPATGQTVLTRPR